MYKIYYCYNKIEKKYYIGRTNNFAKRKQAHYYESKNLKNNSKFKNMLRNFKKEDLEWKILLEVESFEESTIKETEFIKKYNSVENGYNSSHGGEGLGKNICKELKKKFSDIAKNKTGEKNAFFNKKHSDETKEILKIKSTLNWKKVYEKKKKTLSEKPLSEILESNKKISEARKNFSKEKKEEIYKKIIKTKKEKNIKMGNLGKEIVCVEINKTFKNNKELIEYFIKNFNIILNPKEINKCCRKERKSTKGYSFYYKNGYVKKITKAKTKKVYVNELKMNFESIKKCCEYLEELHKEKFFDKYIKENKIYKGYTFKIS